jgi:MFS family permease
MNVVAPSSMDLTVADFGDGYKDADGEASIEPKIIGFMSSCYQLGSILAVPVAPWLSQKYGRRMSIFVGSVIMVVGALLQGFAQHSMSTTPLATS